QVKTGKLFNGLYGCYVLVAVALFCIPNRYTHYSLLRAKDRLDDIYYNSYRRLYKRGGKYAEIFPVYIHFISLAVPGTQPVNVLPVSQRVYRVGEFIIR